MTARSIVKGSLVLRLILSRIGLGLLTLFVVSLVIFVLTQILPGDVASSVLGQGATPENLAAFRHELGLDQPAFTRYLTWLWSACCTATSASR